MSEEMFEKKSFKVKEEEEKHATKSMLTITASGYLMDTKEVAGLLKLHPTTVRRLLRERKVPGIKVGKRWRVRAEDLSKFIKEGQKRIERI